MKSWFGRHPFLGETLGLSLIQDIGHVDNGRMDLICSSRGHKRLRSQVTEETSTIA